MWPVSSTRLRVLFLGELKRLTLWEELAQINAAASPTVPFTKFVARVAWWAPVGCKPIEECVALCVARPNADSVIPNECPHSAIL